MVSLEREDPKERMELQAHRVHKVQWDMSLEKGDQKGPLAIQESLGSLGFQGCQAGLENLGRLAGLGRR